MRRRSVPAPACLRQNLPVDFPDAYTSQRALLMSGLGGSLTQVDGKEYNLKQPMIYKWSLDIQQHSAPIRRWTSATPALAEFTCSVRCNSMRRPREIRDGRRYFLVEQSPRNPYMSRMRWSIFDAESDYHGLRIGVTKQFSRGLQFQTSYTYSKSIDDWSTWVRATDLTTSNRARLHD